MDRNDPLRAVPPEPEPASQQPLFGVPLPPPPPPPTDPVVVEEAPDHEPGPSSTLAVGRFGIEFTRRNNIKIGVVVLLAAYWLTCVLPVRLELSRIQFRINVNLYASRQRPALHLAKPWFFAFGTPKSVTASGGIEYKAKALGAEPKWIDQSVSGQYDLASDTLKFDRALLGLPKRLTGIAGPRE
ncbi:MAG: hypothetical protein OER86_02720 [Phycisphaerae bacterium]|nr:hypothetical protein [Phycisphaerae bacterium]